MKKDSDKQTRIPESRPQGRALAAWGLLFVLVILGAPQGASAAFVIKKATTTMSTSLDGAVLATGGTISTVVESGIRYRVHTFTSSGTFTVTKGRGKVWYLVVAGGGGGGHGGDYTGGGGGAGGMLDSGGYTYSISTGSYSVSVGAGGSGASPSNGGNSAFATITATGGGRGGHQFSPNGVNGGSGGGRSYNISSSGTGIVGQGNDGGINSFNSGDPSFGSHGAAGGGGAGSIGGDASGPSNGGSAGNGGAGRESLITGVSVYYAGGGGGGARRANGGLSYTAGTGGTGGGGNGGLNASGTNGMANTGGGGGGGGDGGNGGNGGSGIVIIRYPVGSTASNASQVGKNTRGLVGHWTFDNPDIFGTTAYDRSGQGNNGTLTNGPVRALGKFGQALSFNGSNQYVGKTSSSVSCGGTNPCSVSVWFKPIGYSDPNGGVIVSATANSGASNVRNFWIAYGSTGMAFQRSNGSSFPTVSTGPISLNAWHHLVYTYDGSFIRAYINGSATSTPLADTTSLSAASGIGIGANLAGGIIYYANGLIDDVRIYNRALSAAEIQGLYNEGAATKPNAPQKNLLGSGLVGYWDFDNKNIFGTTAYDRSGQGNNGTMTNGPVRTAGKVGQALSLDGSDDYVNVAHSSSLEVAGNLTISLWLKPAALPPATNIGFAAKRSLSVGGSSRYHFGINNDLGGYNFYNGTTEYQSAQKPSVGVWSHVAMVLTSGTNVKYYTNGVLVDTIAGATIGAATGDPVTIGASWTDAKFNGAIDEVRIYNRALSAAEVKRLYNVGR